MYKQTVREISLEEMLAAREERAARKIRYVKEYGCTAISFAMNIPGPRKADDEINHCFDEGFQALLRTLEQMCIPLRKAESHYLPTGPEGAVAAEADPLTIKRLAAEIEESHPQGRLFDIDILTENLEPVNRAEIGMPERRCFLCGESAKACGRNRRHSVEELEAAVAVLLRGTGE